MSSIVRFLEWANGELADSLNNTMGLIAKNQGVDISFKFGVSYCGIRRAFVAGIDGIDTLGENVARIEEHISTNPGEAVDNVVLAVNGFIRKGIIPIEKYVLTQYKCQECWIAEGSKQLHPCPYQEDVHNNDAPGNCCSSCQERCKEDI